MTQINMSIPKCCGECPLLFDQSGYPICYITRSEIYDKTGKLLCCPLKENNNSLQKYIDLMLNVLTTDEKCNLRARIDSYATELWASNAINEGENIDKCKEIIDIINNNIECLYVLSQYGGITQEQHDKNVKDYKVCSVCNDLEANDTLYQYTDWDGGHGYEEIRGIQYCPECGRRLLTYEEKKRRAKETFSRVAKQMLEAMEKE